MALLHLVRHGQAESSWGDHLDPGLSDLGRAQAVATGAELARSLEACAIRTSPMQRARETALPLALNWSTTPVIDAGFGEIPSPEGISLAERATWLRSALASHWSDLGPEVAVWRTALLDAVAVVGARGTETVVFTHLVAINAVVAAATGSDAATVFLPANASVTVIDVPSAAGPLRVVSLGSEATPEIG